MEAKEYFKIFQKNFLVIIFCVVLVTISTTIFALSQKTTHEGNGSITIIPESNSGTKANFYEYDGYYALQAASLLGNSIVAWLQSPDVVSKIYKSADVNVNGLSAKQLSKLIKAEMLQNTFAVKYLVKSDDKNKAEVLAKVTTSVVSDKITEFNQSSGTKINFGLQTANPVITEVKPKKELIISASAIFGLILGIFVSLILEYFKKP